MGIVMADVVLILLIIIPLGLFLHMSTIRANNKLFKEVAQSFGFEFKKAVFFNDPEIYGNIGGCPVKLIRITKDKTDLLQVKAMITLYNPPAFHITRETVLTKMQRVVGKKDIETWDGDFDDSMLLDAEYPQTLIALLDVKTRGLIMELSKSSKYFEINNSNVSAEIIRIGRLKAEPVVELIRLAAAVSQNLSEDISIEERFAENIKSDPVPFVRINNILALTIYSSDKARITPILKEALKDSNLEVQVEAAKYLEEDGMNHLVKILESRHQSLEPTLINDILQTLNENNFSKSTGSLKKIYHSHQGDELKKTILQAFTTFADTDLNSFLLAELEKENPGLTLHIIDALATCGQVEAVEKIYKIGKKTLNPITRRKIKEAIIHIQSRLGDGEKGWLSMNILQDIDGALSLDSQPGEGALSPGEEDKQPINGKDT